jgi:hypothetical protein
MMDASFCVGAREERACSLRQAIFNTDQGSQFTSTAFTGTLATAGVRVRMDGRGPRLDKVFIERLWREPEIRGNLSQGLHRRPRSARRIRAWFAFYDAPPAPGARANGRPRGSGASATGAPSETAAHMTLRLDNAGAFHDHSSEKSDRVTDTRGRNGGASNEELGPCGPKGWGPLHRGNLSNVCHSSPQKKHYPILPAHTPR